MSKSPMSWNESNARPAEVPPRVLDLEGHEHLRARAQGADFGRQAVDHPDQRAVERRVPVDGQRVDLRGQAHPLGLDPRGDGPDPGLVRGPDVGLQDAAAGGHQLRRLLRAVEPVQRVDQEDDLLAQRAQVVRHAPPVLDERVHRGSGQQLGPGHGLLEDGHVGDLRRGLRGGEERRLAGPGRDGGPAHLVGAGRGRGRGTHGGASPAAGGQTEEEQGGGRRRVTHGPKLGGPAGAAKRGTSRAGPLVPAGTERYHRVI